jgi:hypothetical protein
MDPDANLEDQLALASKLCWQIDYEREISEVDVNRLADLVISLDVWIKNGGCLPKAWQEVR